jgi:hypothetical protein
VIEGEIIVKKLEKMGRLRSILPEDCLELMLAWSHTRGSMMVLQLIFGTTMSPLSKYLQFARRIIINILKKDPLAKITLPAHDKLQEYRVTISCRHPAVQDVWGTMDGMKIRIGSALDGIVQS